MEDGRHRPSHDRTREDARRSFTRLQPVQDDAGVESQAKENHGLPRLIDG